MLSCNYKKFGNHSVDGVDRLIAKPSEDAVKEGEILIKGLFLCILFTLYALCAFIKVLSQKILFMSLDLL